MERDEVDGWESKEGGANLASKGGVLGMRRPTYQLKESCMLWREMFPSLHELYPLFNKWKHELRKEGREGRRGNRESWVRTCGGCEVKCGRMCWPHSKMVSDWWRKGWCMSGERERSTFQFKRVSKLWCGKGKRKLIKGKAWGWKEWRSVCGTHSKWGGGWVEEGHTSWGGALNP